MLTILQTLGANTTERKILGRAQLAILAVTTRKVFSAARAALKKNNFSVKYARNCINKLFKVVVTFNREDALLTIIVHPQAQETDELFFFNPWKLERFLIQNRHHAVQNLFILTMKSTSSGVNLNQYASGLVFCFCKISLT